MRLLLLILAVLATSPAIPDGVAPTDPGQGGGDKLSLTCPDAEVLSPKMIWNTCWNCLFPIRIAGAEISGGKAPSAASGIYKPTTRPLCVCQDNLGVPFVGFTLSLWEPARLIELVRRPGCHPVLGGLRVGSFGLVRTGGFNSSRYDASDQAYRNYHYYAFPLLILTDLLTHGHCFSEGFQDFDLLYLSELDPTWNNDELALLTAMESIVFANPVAQAACIVDAISSTAGVPLNPLFWCAGTWGFMYPLSGNTQISGASPRFTSLMATRAVFALHRRGLAHRTMGDDVLCRTRIHPFIVKSQYKMAMFYPVAETKGNHWIGQSPYLWGIWRNYPGHGEDHVYTLWRWRDCCSSIIGKED